MSIFIIILLDFHSGEKKFLLWLLVGKKMREFIMFKQWQPWKTRVNDDIKRINQRNIWSNKKDN